MSEALTNEALEVALAICGRQVDEWASRVQVTSTKVIYRPDQFEGPAANAALAKMIARIRRNGDQA